MSDTIKKEFYRLLDLLEQAQQQADGLDIGPLVSVETGNSLLTETQKLREGLADRIVKIKQAMRDLGWRPHA